MLRRTAVRLAVVMQIFLDVLRRQPRGILQTPILQRGADGPSGLEIRDIVAAVAAVPRDRHAAEVVHLAAPPFDIAQIQHVTQTACAVARHGLMGIAASQNLWRVEEDDAMGQAAEQERSVHLAAAFDQQVGDVLFSKLLE